MRQVSFNADFVERNSIHCEQVPRVQHVGMPSHVRAMPCHLPLRTIFTFVHRLPRGPACMRSCVRAGMRACLRVYVHACMHVMRACMCAVHMRACAGRVHVGSNTWTHISYEACSTVRHSCARAHTCTYAARTNAEERDRTRSRACAHAGSARP